MGTGEWKAKNQLTRTEALRPSAVLPQELLGRERCAPPLIPFPTQLPRSPKGSSSLSLSLSLTLCVLGHAQSQQQHDNAEQVRHVAGEAEDVHAHDDV